MLKNILIMVLFELLCVGSVFAAEDGLPGPFISFGTAEELAIKNSYLLAAQKYTVQSAGSRASAQKVKRLPSLSFNASSMFQSQIGQITIPQLGLTRTVGEHTNWSAGPALNFVIFDAGQITNKARSLAKITDAEGQNLETDLRQVLLNARSAYINVQLAKEQLRYVRDALALAKSQYADISHKKEAGTADLLDLTVAHEEIVDRQKDLEQANGDLAVAKRALIAALGYDSETENCDAVDVEPVSSVLSTLLPRAQVPVDVKEHPQVKSLANQQHSSELAAKSTIAKYFPQISLQGTATYQYPNLGINNTVQQNQLTLGLGLPIIDWGMINKESKSYKYQAHSTGEQKNQTIINLAQQTAATRERIDTLKALRIENVKAVKDAVEIARLTYEAYKAGRIIFLEVQRVNVKALAVEVNSAQTDAELGIQIANLLALAETEGGPK